MDAFRRRASILVAGVFTFLLLGWWMLGRIDEPGAASLSSQAGVAGASTSDVVRTLETIGSIVGWRAGDAPPNEAGGGAGAGLL